MRNLIIFFLLFAFFFILFRLPAKRLLPQLKPWLTWKNNLPLAGGYLVFLMLFVSLAMNLPKDYLIHPGENANGVIMQDITFDFPDLSSPPVEDLSQIPNIYKNCSRTFKLNRNTLKFSTQPETEYRQILIERKKTDDNEIEVSTYVAPHWIGPINLTHLVQPPQILLVDGTLVINPPLQQKLDFKRFDGDFSVKQFRSVDSYPLEHSANMGWKAVYLRIPKNLEIINPKDFFIQWVEAPSQNFTAN